MNIAIWVVQILLGLAFFMSGIMKATQPIEKLSQQMAYVNDFQPSTIRLIGILEVLGAIGVVLPAALGWVAWLTPAAAVGLVLTMVGAIMTHLRRKEPFVVNIVLLVLAAFVVYGRLIALPL